MADEQLLTCRELASRLRLHPSTVAKLKGVPCVRIGKAKRFAWSVVMAWLADHQGVE